MEETMSAEPERVDLETPDLAAEGREAFKALFPGVIADGVLDAERLGELLDIPITAPSDGSERFGLMWAGKQEAVRSLLLPSRGSLVPDTTRSLAFDTAENVFIAGDNLEVLKLLQKAYNDRVRLIYIDPPYNTGKDFVYNDDFRDGLRTYLEYVGALDLSGNRTSADVDTAGRRHSRWLSMMYPRLVLGRNLLTQDGVIFVSIDDHEVAELRLILDEIFGPENFVENYVWESNFRPDNSSAIERENSQHILCYARNKQKLGRLFGTQKKTEGLPSLTKSSMGMSTLMLDPDWVDFGLADGDYEPGDRGSGYVLEDAVIVRGGRAQAPFRLTGRVIWSQTYLQDQVLAGTRIVIKGPGFVPYSKKGETAPLPPTSLISREDVGDVLAGNAELRAIFGAVPFSFPKPTTLIKYLVNAVTHDDKSALVMDFFAGSGSTAHAVTVLNASDGGRRRSISVNLPEPVPAGSTAQEMGFKVVSDVALARLKKVMAPDGGPGLGLRVYTLGSSNFRDHTDAGPDELFDLNASTLRGGERSVEAMAAEVLLKEGVPLDATWDRSEAGGAPVILAEGVAVVLSLDVTDEVVSNALALSPRVAVFLEDGLAGADAVKANAVTNAKNLGITLKTV
jgi:adenine-specific DNA-methyltransferase